MMNDMTWKTLALCSISAMAGMLFVVACGAGPDAAGSNTGADDDDAVGDDDDSMGGGAATGSTVYTVTCEGNPDDDSLFVAVPGLVADGAAPPLIQLWLADATRLANAHAESNNPTFMGNSTVSATGAALKFVMEWVHIDPDGQVWVLCDFISEYYANENPDSAVAGGTHEIKVVVF